VNIFDSTTFDIVVTNPCDSATLTATNPANLLYYLSDSTDVDFSTYFTPSHTSCILVYEAYSDSGLSTVADASLFNIDDSTGILTVSSSDTSLHGNVYSVYVKSYFNSYPSTSATSTIQITFSYCKMTTVTTPTYVDLYYDLGATSLISTYTAWTSSYSASCGSFSPVATIVANGT
jgi:hypothetical protein